MDGGNFQKASLMDAQGSRQHRLASSLVVMGAWVETGHSYCGLLSMAAASAAP